ncbi:hypothetical protein ECZU34_58150 [Escherichia coli]|nr:hypothetical protein ECZU34_58150 [Escherichia coli]
MAVRVEKIVRRPFTAVIFPYLSPRLRQQSHHPGKLFFRHAEGVVGIVAFLRGVLRRCSSSDKHSHSAPQER